MNAGEAECMLGRGEGDTPFRKNSRGMDDGEERCGRSGSCDSRSLRLRESVEVW